MDNWSRRIQCKAYFLYLAGPDFQVEGGREGESLQAAILFAAEEEIIVDTEG